MKNFYYIFVLFFLSSAFMPVSGEKSYSVEEIIQIAVKNSNILKAEDARLKGMEGSVKQSKRWKNPQVSASYGVRSESGSSTLGIPEAGGKGYGYSVSLTQPFSSPGKKKMGTEIQKTLKDNAGLSLENSKRRLYYDVIFLTFSYREVDEHLEHLNERYRRFQKIQRFLKSRQFVSPQKKMEKVLIQNHMDILNQEIKNKLTRKDILWKRLNLYLEFENPVEIRSSWYRNGIVLDQMELRSKIHDHSKTAQQRNEIEMKKIEKKKAKRERFPDYALSLIYSEEKVSQTEKFIGAGVTVEIPLWNRNSGRISYYDSEIQAEEEELKHLEKKILSELDEFLYDYENKRKILKKYPMSSLSRVHRQMAEADGFFRRGVLDILTYLEMDQSSSDLHEVYFHVQMDYIAAYLKVLEITGQMNFKEEK
ncbi:MAG: TolC family protein [Spirochaetia bacterium]|nr:TolC family protein [Spirochaetia bacterium]